VQVVKMGVRVRGRLGVVRLGWAVNQWAGLGNFGLMLRLHSASFVAMDRERHGAAMCSLGWSRNHPEMSKIRDAAHPLGRVAAFNVFFTHIVVSNGR
jgi:hypothetical protein